MMKTMEFWSNYIPRATCLKNNTLAAVIVGFILAVSSICILNFNGMTNGIPIQNSGTVCYETFNNTLAENIKVIENYPKGHANKYLVKMGGDQKRPVAMSRFPVIVTAINRIYYPASMGLFHSIHKVLMGNPRYRGKVKVVVYDLGVTPRQLKMLHRKCRCEVRKFPFEDFPEHVRLLKTYAFKPIVIQMALLQWGFIWWVDASVRFNNSNVDNVINYAEAHGLVFATNDDVNNTLSIPKQTDVQMFSFLKEDSCKFRNFSEVSATSVVFRFNGITTAIVRAWVICAVNSDCISPAETSSKQICDVTDSRDGRCHRFDQSVFSILTRRLYHDENHFGPGDMLNNVIDIRRADTKFYFERCGGDIRNCLV